ncbi:unnamed protein product [Rhodiola kirilowii]
MDNATNLKKILDEYEALSGQKVNLAKSEIFFGKNLGELDKQRISAALGVRQVEIMSKYLGLPIAFGHNRTELFRDIVGRVWKKLQGWKEKALSIAGKEVLIKAVVQAMPTYAMSCFKIPVSLIKRLVGMIANYWWSNNKAGGIHWCRFKKLCKEKGEGGVGFKDLYTFNDALLAKQIWRLMERPNSLTSKLLKEKYFKEATPITCQLGSRPSLVWRSIRTAGQKVKQWLQEANDSEGVSWLLEADGKFSTKSAYKALKTLTDQLESNLPGEQMDRSEANQFWRVIWKTNVQPKVKLFAWRLFHDYIPSATNLAKKGMEEIRKCPVCGWTGETTIHTILYCWWAQAFWKKMSFECSFVDYKFQEVGDWLWYCIFNYGKLEINMILQGARTIWLNRNSMLFGANGQNPYIAAEYVYQQARSIQTGEQKLTVTDLSEGVRWSKPERGTVKVNVDGAWDRISHRAGVGILCRDDEGLARFAAAHPVSGIKACVEVEQAALAKAMEMAEREKLIRVTFETDSAQVFNSLMQGENIGGQNGGVLQWCKDRLEANFSWNVNLISREANEGADLLAKKAKVESWSWDNPAAIPLCISATL